METLQQLFFIYYVSAILFISVPAVSAVVAVIIYKLLGN